MRDLRRLLNPRHIAVIGGGAWCASILEAAARIGFSGRITPVHPTRAVIAGRPAARHLVDIDGPVDAAFVGINRHATLDAVAELARLDAGGAVCFASGFTEAVAEDETGADLQADLIRAAGDMPVLGPNCYGFINALDGVAIWPDQHGMRPVDRGVAILTQSSNIAINLTMQQRALPIAYMVTCGNMAQTSQAELAMALLDDDRVSVIGLHVEGFGDLRGWERLARKARTRGVPLIAIKVGRSQQARAATVSHTASLAGEDTGAQAFLDRLGIARLNGLLEFLETLKLLHFAGPLSSGNLACISCSGGEASLVADLAHGGNLRFPPLSDRQKQSLRTALGPMVALANPLDYHTYIWRDPEAMTRAWSGMTGDDIALTLSVVDYPHTDHSDWACATQAAIATWHRTNAPFGVVASLPELMPPDVAQQLADAGVIPFMGLSEALSAADVASRPVPPPSDPVLIAPDLAPLSLLSEAQAKSDLSAFGLPVPPFGTAQSPAEAAEVARGLQAPLALKGMGLAHKSEHGAVHLGLTAETIEIAATRIATNGFLIEEMITDGVAELLIGVTRDPAHGFVLTLGAGGTLTELWRDTVSMLVPVGPDQIKQALTGLKCAPLLQGYRGRPAAELDAVVAAVMAVQAYVVANAHRLCEVEINPLICTPTRAVAVDALIRLGGTAPGDAATPPRGADCA